MYAKQKMKRKTKSASIIFNNKKSNPEVFVIGKVLGKMNLLSNDKVKG